MSSEETTAGQTYPDSASSASDFRKELESLINRHSKENGSNTPDYMLADFLCTCLVAFDTTVNARDRWYGIAPVPGWTNEHQKKPNKQDEGRET